MGAPTKPKRKRNKSRKPVSRRTKRLDFSGLTPTPLRHKMNDSELTETLTALIVIADDFMPSIDFPFQAESYSGSHPFETEVMMFFPGVKTKREYPIQHIMTFNGKPYVVAAFPDTESPLGETGLMYVCRQFKTEPSLLEATQFVLDSIDGTWIVPEQ